MELIRYVSKIDIKNLKNYSISLSEFIESSYYEKQDYNDDNEYINNIPVKIIIGDDWNA